MCIAERMDDFMSEPENIRGTLFAGGFAAILASTCCLGPLLLVALFFAWRRIFLPAQDCKPGEMCSIPQVRSAYKLVFRVVTAMVLAALAFPYVLPMFY